MTIRKVFGGRAVQFENLHDEDKPIIINHIKEINKDIIGKPFKGEGSEGGTQHRMRVGQDALKFLLETIERDWWWPLTENDRLGLKTTWLGYPTKEAALGIVEQASGEQGKTARQAARQEEVSEQELEEAKEEFIESVLESKGSIMDVSLRAYLESYLAESEPYGTGLSGDLTIQERSDTLAIRLKHWLSMITDQINDGHCFPIETIEMGKRVARALKDEKQTFSRSGTEGSRHGAKPNQIKNLNDMIGLMEKHKCEPVEKWESALKLEDNLFESFKEFLDDSDRAPQPPEDMFDREPKNPIVKRDWWNSLKGAGPVTTGNAGTKPLFNNQAINPPKKEEEEEEEYDIIPDEKDFWRD